MTEARVRISPFLNTLGVEKEAPADGYARISLVVEKRHTNGLGIMHGGVMMSLMDEALAGAVSSLRAPDPAKMVRNPTVEMNISFVRPAQLGEEIVVEGRVIRAGRSIVFGEAEAYRKGHPELIAKARQVFAIVEQERLTGHKGDNQHGVRQIAGSESKEN